MKGRWRSAARSSVAGAALPALSAFVGACAAWGASAGCNAILGNEPGALADAPGGADAGADAGDVCHSVTYPPPPAQAGPSGAVEFSVAVRTIDLGEAAPKDAPVGLDIDNMCTCSGDAPSCVYPPYATADHCDKPGGVDNAASVLFGALTSAVGADTFGSAYFNKSAEAGGWTLLARVSDFNGTPDDGQVTVALYSPAGLESSAITPGGPSCVGPGGGPPGPAPCWNGDDVWSVADGSVAPGGGLESPLYVDKDAYVASGVLVANLGDVFIGLGGGASTYWGVRLTAATLVGVLDNPATDDLGWRIKSGTIAGRWRLSHIFGGLGSAVTGGQTICTDTLIIYPVLKERICESADILSKLGGPTIECDSVSFGMGFSTVPVHIGAVKPVAPLVNNCVNGNDPALDSCGSGG